MLQRRHEDAVALQVAMYERTRNFVHGFGVLFQDCTGKKPSKAMRRQSPWILYYTTLWFIHKVVLAYVFGAFANDVKSWQQISILVRSVACHALSASVELQRKHGTHAMTGVQVVMVPVRVAARSFSLASFTALVVPEAGVCCAVLRARLR